MMNEKTLYEQLGIGRTRKTTGETILSYKEALATIHHVFEEESFIILGGDVLNTNDEYIYAFWNYEIDSALSPMENARLSCHKALTYITSLKNKEMCNYIFVLDSK